MIKQEIVAIILNLKKKIAFLLIFCVSLIWISAESIQGERIQTMNSKQKELEIKGNIVFFYYKNLKKTQDFYQDILGLNLVADYEFAKIFQISQTSYVALIDEKKGMHSTSEPKTATLSFITDEIDDWYNYLKEKGVEMRGPARDAKSHPTRGFVAFDPEGYYLEFERFLDHEQNKKLLDILGNTEAVYPGEGQLTSRPKKLGFQANIIFLYYLDLEAAQRFYENVFGFKLVVEQAFARIYCASPTFFVGLVDQARGMHRYSEEKAVNLAFLTSAVDRCYQILRNSGLKTSEVTENFRIFPRSFVTYDIGGYSLEFSSFQDFEKRKK